MSVNGASAIASEPTNIAPSPKPTASGEPLRAPIRRLSSPANRKASAKAPRSRGSAFLTASAGEAPRRISSVTRCAMTSVSVSLVNFAPFFSSSSRSSPKFSMMPLCTTASLSVACGCALFSVGRPCVAQRVWPMPIVPDSGSRASLVSRFLQLAFGAPARQRAMLQRRDARGIVTAIFEPLERIDELRRRRLAADHSDNAAHPLGCSPQPPSRRSQ